MLDDDTEISQEFDLKSGNKHRTVSNQPNYTTCATWCAETFKCTHWTYDKVSSDCYLKTSDGGARKFPAPSRISGNRACGCVRHQNVDYIGNVINDTTKRTSTEACADWCGVLFL